jgi:hypothetical protein
MHRADLRRRADPYTDRLLQVLKDADAKATFFMIGNKVAANRRGQGSPTPAWKSARTPGNTPT